MGDDDEKINECRKAIEALDNTVPLKTHNFRIFHNIDIFIL